MPTTFRPASDEAVTFVIDPSMYGEHYAPPLHVYGDLGRVVRTDLRYHYSTPVCAQRWLDVCEDPAYGHQRLLDQIDTVFPRMTEALRGDLGSDPPIHLTSLGPGDGALDLSMLRSLSFEFSIGSYLALDSSFDLLRRAVHRVAWAEGFRQPFPVRAVCGDFTDLTTGRPDPPAPPGVRVFGLTGFTLGNYREETLLGDIGSLMGPGDYLFLDARLHQFGGLSADAAVSLPESDAWAKAYDLPSVRDFVFGPVEVATEARARDVEIGFEMARTLTSVPGAVNAVIYCSDLETRMRLTGEPVSRRRLDLAVTTAYDYRSLVRWIQGTELSVVWHEALEDVAFFLLKRT